MEETTPYGTTDGTDKTAAVPGRSDEDRLRGLLSWIVGYAGAASEAPWKLSTVSSLKDDLALIKAKCEDALAVTDPGRNFRDHVKRVAQEPCPILGDLKFKEVSGGGQ